MELKSDEFQYHPMSIRAFFLTQQGKLRPPPPFYSQEKEGQALRQRRPLLGAIHPTKEAWGFSKTAIPCHIP
eukprot:scaffold57955_cov19-Tisochrysis_lutea.AAC.1